MSMVKCMNQWIQKNMIKIISCFLILGPIFDLITSLSSHLFHVNMSIIMVIKVLFMLLLMYYILIIYDQKNKKKIIFYGILLGIYFLVYSLLIIVNKSVNALSYEIPYLFRTYFFSITLLGIYSVYQKEQIKISNKILVISLLEYLILLLLPFLTKTGFDSYAYSKVGSIGWFNSTNEIGGILSILFPLSLSYFWSTNKKVIPIYLLIYFYIIFSIGSKVPVLTTFFTLLLFLCFYLKNNPKKIKLFILPLLVVLSLSIYLFPKTNFYKNIQIHLDFLEIHSIKDLMTIENIDHFIFSSRLKFLNQTRSNYQKSNLASHLFGIGYIENYGTDELNLKTIEMDYFDIFYRNGMIGFFLFLLPFICILYKNKGEKVEKYTLFLALLLAFFQGHILTAPSVSIYVIIILLNGGKYEKLCCNN